MGEDCKVGNLRSVLNLAHQKCTLNAGVAYKSTEFFPIWEPQNVTEIS